MSKHVLMSDLTDAPSYSALTAAKAAMDADPQNSALGLAYGRVLRDCVQEKGYAPGALGLIPDAS
jgi:hypothetical protein